MKWQPLSMDLLIQLILSCEPWGLIINFSFLMGVVEGILRLEDHKIKETWL
jgi:hypothetical protein